MRVCVFVCPSIPSCVRVCQWLVGVRVASPSTCTKEDTSTEDNERPSTGNLIRNTHARARDGSAGELCWSPIAKGKKEEKREAVSV